MPRAYIKELEETGVRIAPTSPLYRLHTISYRNHRKITVIDGIIGYTGGMNISREHLSGGKGFKSWRDTQVRIDGEGAAALQTVFMIDWYNAVRENLFSPAYFPTVATDHAEGKTPIPNPDLRSGFGMGGHPAALLLHDRDRPATGISAITIFCSRRQHS